jgi:hypothetical protein
LSTLSSGCQALFLRLWQTNGFNDNVKRIGWNFFLGRVDRLNAKVFTVVSQLFIRTASQRYFMNTTRLQNLCKQLTFKAIPQNQGFLDGCVVSRSTPCIAQEIGSTTAAAFKETLSGTW